jgi:hypothetical protein
MAAFEVNVLELAMIWVMQRLVKVVLDINI